jgi:hypothetical protein
MSPGGADSHIALLTPGPYNETYFEHAYLARYLGLTLVEGGDITVRDERLYLKTLRGLEPVHGLLKRLDDPFLDPLELRPDSTLGVPGLLQAVRAGNVLVANAPGSAFLESPRCWVSCRRCRAICWAKIAAVARAADLVVRRTRGAGRSLAAPGSLRHQADLPDGSASQRQLSTRCWAGTVAQRELDEWAGRIAAPGGHPHRCRPTCPCRRCRPGNRAPMPMPARSCHVR